MEVKEQTACAVWALAGDINTQQKYIAEKITIPHLIDMLLLASDKLQYVGKYQNYIILPSCVSIRHQIDVGSTNMISI